MSRLPVASPPTCAGQPLHMTVIVHPWGGTTWRAPPSHARSPALLKLVDPDRLLFGSDYCWTPSPLADAHIAAIDAAEPPAEGTTWRSLTTANAKRLFQSTP